MHARWPRQGRARPLRCSRPTAAEAPAGGGSAAAPDRVCRMCWDTEAAGNCLVEPCACSGSMRYVHEQCLRTWQAQLRAQKGVAAARRCDVCKARWARAHQPPAAPTDWRQLLRDVGRSVPWAAVLECWKCCVVVMGAVHGMQAGMAGFRTGLQWAAAPSRRQVQGLSRWAPEMALAAGAMPPLKVPMAVCLLAFAVGLAAQVAVVSLACAYAGSLLGFASGIAGSVQATLQLGGLLLRHGAVAANAAALGAVRGVAAVGRLATPLVMALLKTLALSRLFS